MIRTSEAIRRAGIEPGLIRDGPVNLIQGAIEVMAEELISSPTELVF